MSGNIVCDTIFLNNPGKTSNLGGNITFTELVCNGTPAFPVFLKGNPIALLNKTSGQVCIANALLQDYANGRRRRYLQRGQWLCGPRLQWLDLRALYRGQQCMAG